MDLPVPLSLPLAQTAEAIQREAMYIQSSAQPLVLWA